MAESTRRLLSFIDSAGLMPVICNVDSVIYQHIIYINISFLYISFTLVLCFLCVYYYKLHVIICNVPILILKNFFVWLYTR